VGSARGATDHELVAVELMSLLETFTGCYLSEVTTRSVDICEHVFSAAALATIDHLRLRKVTHADIYHVLGIDPSERN
jgi:hypothetical protein